MSACVLHCARILVLTVMLLACMFLPFFPGDYDRFAVTVSAMVQALGFAGLLLVPFGVIWLVHEMRRRARSGRSSSGTDLGYYLAIASLCAAALIAAIVSLGAFVSTSLTLGLASFALSAYGLARLARRLGSLKHSEERSFNFASVYLVIVPIALVCARFLFLEPAVEFSRARAIKNSAGLIAEIEGYREARGHYPLTLAGLWRDYDPGVIGIQQYEYEPRGDAYSVYFEQFAVPVGTREMVMYNKLDEHAFASHDTDRLRWTSEELAARPGHYAVYEASSPHWKYFWFD